ncbi:MAG: T9SS type B sorting domain-containing protein [Bacteroidetes bacterium]|nr:T9SS type B sorting domain-containing protein [Bacteroidota bacterium]
MKYTLTILLLILSNHFLFSQEICNNGMDDDGDTLVDCDDPDCTDSGGLFPIIEDFNGGVLNDPNWVLQGSAQLVTDWLRLTDDIGGQAGNATMNSAFSSSDNIIVEFEYATVDYNGSNCTFGIGDGLAFFLIDGTASPSLGVSGAALGYSHGQTGDPSAGIDGGFIAIGLDEFGNFAGGNAAPSTCGQLGSDAITIRGEETANNSTAYRCITTSLLPGNADIDVASRADARKVRIILSPGGILDLFMDLNDGNGLQPLFTDLNTGQAVPPTFILGFSSSTGGACIAHEIDNLKVGKPTDIALDINVASTISICDGQIQWEVTAVNQGPNDAAGISIDNLITGAVENVSWECGSCVQTSGSGGNSFSIGADPDVGDTVVIIITADLSQGAAGTDVSLDASASFGCTGLISSNSDNSMAGSMTSVTEFEVTADLGTDVSVCDSVVVLDATFTDAEYNWQDGSSDPVFTAESTGLYWVEVSVGDCSDTDSIEVEILATPAVSISGELTFCESESTILTAVTTGSFDLLQWSDGSSDEELEVDEPGLFSVTVSNTCGAVSDSTIVEAEACACEYILPNAFSPNADGLNDRYMVSTSAAVDQIHMEIYDRWGERVFETDELGFAWNGQFRGRTLPTDVYYYFAEIRCSVNGRVTIEKGNITLIR